MTNKYDLKVTGKRIAELREEKGLTQGKLAKDLKVSSSLIGHYERDRSIPIDMLYEIAKYFNISADYLLGLSNCKTTKADLKTFCDSTGIDDTSVEILEEINFVYEGNYLIPLLNYLIKEETLPPDEAFFEGIYSKIENSNMSDTEKKKYLRKVQSIYDRMYARWKNKKCQPILSSIEDYFVTNAEDINLCLTLSGKIKKEEEITNELDIRKKISNKEILDEVILKEIIKDLKKSKEKYNKEIKK